MDVPAQKMVVYELQATLKTMQPTLSEVKTLRGLLPNYACCKRIRSKEWNGTTWRLTWRHIRA